MASTPYARAAISTGDPTGYNVKDALAEASLNRFVKDKKTREQLNRVIEQTKKTSQKRGGIGEFLSGLGGSWLGDLALQGLLPILSGGTINPWTLRLLSGLTQTGAAAANQAMWAKRADTSGDIKRARDIAKGTRYEEDIDRLDDYYSELGSIDNIGLAMAFGGGALMPPGASDLTREAAEEALKEGTEEGLGESLKKMAKSMLTEDQLTELGEEGLTSSKILETVFAGDVEAIAQVQGKVPIFGKKDWGDPTLLTGKKGLPAAAGTSTQLLKPSALLGDLLKEVPGGSLASGAAKTAAEAAPSWISDLIRLGGPQAIPAYMRGTKEVIYDPLQGEGYSNPYANPYYRT